MSNQAKIEVIASADITQSVEQFKKVDLPQISSALKSGNIAINIPITFDSADFKKKLDAQIKEISKNIKVSIPAVADVKTGLTNANASLKLTGGGISQSSLQNQIDTLEKYKTKLLAIEELYVKLGTRTVPDFTDMRKQIDSLSAVKIDESNYKTAASQLSALKKSFFEAEQAARQYSIEMQGLQRMTRREDAVQSQIDSLEKYKTKLFEIEGAYAKLGGTVPDFTDMRKQIDSLSAVNPGTLNQVELRAVAEELKELQQDFFNAEQAAKQFATEQRDNSAIIKRQAAIESLKNSLQKLLDNKRVEGSDFSGQINDYIGQLSAPNLSQVDFESIKAKVAQMNAELHQSGLLTETLGQKALGAFKRLTGIATITAVIAAAKRVIQAMVADVMALDKAMTELRKVTDESEASYARFVKSAIQSSKTLGAGLSEVVTATADYARLGYSVSDAQRLAEVSILYKNVGDGISNISDASESIISTMKAFGIEARDAISIVDKFNEVGNNFAISSKGIGDALVRSASALAAAGNSIDESIGIITAINDILQDPDRAGTAARTISMRLRNTAAALKEMDVDAEGASESVTKLQQSLLDLTGGRINIMASNDEFKNTYTILSELSGVWGDLTDVQQASITRLVAGVQQGNAFTAVMKNMSTGIDATAKSMDSQGSAMAENEKYLNSIAGRLSLLTAEFNQLSAEFISSGFVKGVIDLGTGFLALINNIGGLRVVLPIITGLTVALKSQDISKFIKDTVGSTSDLHKFAKAVTEAGGGIKGLIAGFSSAGGLSVAIGAVSLALSVGMSLWQKYRQQVEEARRKSIEAAEKAKNEAENISALYSEYARLTEATKTDSAAKDEMLKIQADLLKALGYEGEAVDKLAEKYSGLSEAINQTTNDKLKQTQADLVAGLAAAKDELLEVGKAGFWENNTFTVNKNDEDSIRLARILSSQEGVSVRQRVEGKDMPASYSSRWATNMSVEFVGSDTVEGLIQNYNALSEARQLAIAEFENGAGELDLYKKITQRLNELKPAIENYKNAIIEVNRNQAQQIVNNALIASGIPKTREEFSKLSEAVRSGAVTNKGFVGTADDIKSALDDIWQSDTRTSGFFTEIKNEMSGFSPVVNSVAKAISDYNEKIATTNRLFAEQELNGQISAETYDYILTHVNDLTEGIIAQYDELGNFKSWQLNTVEISKYAEAQRKTTVETLKEHGATAKQISQLNIYQGELGTTSERIIEICGDIDELTTAYEKSADGQYFTFAEMEKLKAAYPELGFELVEVKDKLGDVSLSYQLNGNTALDLIDKNYGLIGSLQDLRTEFARLLKVSELMKQGLSQGNSAQLVGVWTKNIIESGAQSVADYAKYFKLEESDLSDRLRQYIEEYTSAIKVADETIKPYLENPYTKPDESSSTKDLWKAEFDQLLSDLQYKRSKDLISESDYYEQSKALYEKYFGERMRATIADSEKRQEYLEIWRGFDVDYYKYSLDLQRTSVDELINSHEKLYRVHQDETKYIENLISVSEDYADILSDTQKADIQSKIESARAEYYDNLIRDIEHEIYLRGREKETELERIQLYEKAQRVLLDKKQFYISQGYDATSNELQNLEKQYNQFADNIVSIMENAFKELISAQETAIKEMTDKLKTEQSALDTALDAVVAHLKRRLKAEIDAKKTEIDAINDHYDEYEKQVNEHYKQVLETAKNAYDEDKKAQTQYYDDLIANAKKSSEAQVDALDSQVKAYKDLIDARKEALRAAHEEASYQKELAKRNKDISSIQADINTLQFDDSNAARAQRLKLEEELAKSQSDLEDFQGKYALDNQLDALDKEYKAYEDLMKKKIDLEKENTEAVLEEYEKQKDAYFENLEAEYEARVKNIEESHEIMLADIEKQQADRVAAYQAEIDELQLRLEKEGNLRREANDLLLSEGQALWDELMAYEWEYREDIKSLEEAWDIAHSAMTEYNGGQLNVLETLDLMIAKMTEYNNLLSSLNNASYGNVVEGMKTNSAAWSASASDAERSALHEANNRLAESFNNSIGAEALTYNDHEGRWYLGDVPLYHNGAENGFVMQSQYAPLKQHETYAKLAAGELVLTPPQLDRLAKTMFSAGESALSMGGGYKIEKLMDIHIETVNESTIGDLEGLLKRAADYTIEKMDASHRRKGITTSARKGSI